MVLHYKKGRPMFEWELKQKGMRNEPLDVRNYAQAAVVISGVTLKEKKGRKRKPQESGQETAGQQAAGQQTAARKRRKRGQRSGGI